MALRVFRSSVPTCTAASKKDTPARQSPALHRRSPSRASSRQEASILQDHRTATPSLTGPPRPPSSGAMQAWMVAALPTTAASITEVSVQEVTCLFRCLSLRSFIQNSQLFLYGAHFNAPPHTHTQQPTLPMREPKRVFPNVRGCGRLRGFLRKVKSYNSTLLDPGVQVICSPVHQPLLPSVFLTHSLTLLPFPITTRLLVLRKIKEQNTLIYKAHGHKRTKCQEALC